METLCADVQHMRKGLDTVKNERDKQPENYVCLVSFRYLYILTHFSFLLISLYYRINSFQRLLFELCGIIHFCNHLAKSRKYVKQISFENIERHFLNVFKIFSFVFKFADNNCF